MLSEGGNVMPQTIIKFELVGFKELYDELQMLSKNLQKRGANAMASEGAAIVRDAAKPMIYKAEKEYFSYIDEAKGEFMGMTIGGRNKKGMMRTLFQPGHLARNLFIGKVKSKTRMGRVFWRVFLSPAAWFGIFIEYGTPKFPAHPFIRPALKNNIPRILEAMKWKLKWFLYDQHFKFMKVK